MRIGIVDVDGHNFPNFALMKIAASTTTHTIMTPDFNTMTPAHIHCRTTAVRSCGTARSSYHANAMQMTRRAVETAKDITCAYCVSVGVGNSYESTEKSEIIDASVEMATMLIEKLKRIQKI